MKKSAGYKMKAPSLFVHMFLVFGFLTACGQTKTISSESSPELSPSAKAKEAINKSTELGRTIRFLCDDGSSYSSFLTASLSARDSAFASRVLLYSPGVEENLIVDLHRPQIISISGGDLHFIFEGSRFRDSFDSNDPFFPQIFRASFNFKSKETKVDFLATLPDLARGAASAAEKIGLTIRRHGLGNWKSSFLIPVGDLPFYEWDEGSDANLRGKVPCSPAECFNPEGGISGRFAAFDHYDEAENKFSVVAFERSDDGFEFKNVSLPAEGGLLPHFLGKRLAWLERTNSQWFWKIFNAEDSTSSSFLLANEDDFSKSKRAWSSSLNQQTIGVLSWGDKSFVKLEIFSPVTSQASHHLVKYDFLGSLPEDEDLNVYSFALLDDQSGLVSFETKNGPRLFLLDWSASKVSYQAITRTNCADFSIGVEGKSDAL